MSRCPDALARCQALGACVLFGPQSVMPLNGPTSGGYVVTLTGEYFGVSASAPGLQAKVGATSCMVSQQRGCVVLTGPSGQNDSLFRLFSRACSLLSECMCARDRSQLGHSRSWSGYQEHRFHAKCLQVSEHRGRPWQSARRVTGAGMGSAPDVDSLSACLARFATTGRLYPMQINPPRAFAQR